MLLWFGGPASQSHNGVVTGSAPFPSARIDIGMDTGSPIDFTYQMPFKVTGKISHVTIDLGPLDVGEKAKAG